MVKSFNSTLKSFSEINQQKTQYRLSPDEKESVNKLTPNIERAFLWDALYM